MSKSTMLANMFNFLPSGITKDTSMMFWERSLSKRNYFARPSIAPEGALSMRAPFKDQIIKGQLSVKTVTLLCNDILVNWDMTYSRDHFETCKDFDGPVDKECNRHIPATKLNQAPFIQNPVDMFCVTYSYLTVDMVWIIVQSKPGNGFQS
jgi:hypothetical protein